MNRLIKMAVWTIVATALLVACSVNPATGKRQLMLVSSGQELAMGAQSDKAIVAQMGLYDDPEVQAYVDRLGQRLAAVSEMPDLDWHFRVIDDPVVNAFALPGGYVYITRGILAHMNSEAELVSVLGHEIGHVTGRHGASRMSKGMFAQLGLIGGMVLAPEATQQYGGMVQQGVGLLFLKYSRADERQADELGMRYLLRDGWDPRPMREMFETLQRVGADAGSGRLPGWMSTHPAPENRAVWVDRAIAERNVADIDTRRVGHDRHLDVLDGIAFGEDPRKGYFEDTHFYHPDMAFQLRFPSGWKTQNTAQAVLAGPPEQDAVMRLSFAPGKTAQEAWDAFRGQEGIEIDASAPPRVGGYVTAGGAFRAATQQGNMIGEAAFVEFDGRVFALMGYASESRWSARRAAIRGSIESFARLTDRSKLDVAAARLRIVTNVRNRTAEAFASAHDASVPPATLATINHVVPGALFQGGERYKVVTGGRR